MEILPPRRRGQLGAITAGAGVQGPSGGFSIQASSSARASTSPAPPKTTQAPKGSVAKPVTPSVSEQVALRQSTSQAAAAKTMPAYSPGGTYSAPTTVGVRTYVPPPSTPAITQPAALPNSSATVKALANQIPQNQAQAIQKVLAADAGIAVPVKGPPTIVPANPPLPRALPPQPPPPVRNPVVSPGIAPPRPAPFVPPASGGAFNVNATTGSNIPNRMPAPLAPVLTPAVMKTAAAATSAVVGAKVAEQKAASALMRASNAAANMARADNARRAAEAAAKSKIDFATKKFSDLQALAQKTSEVLASQIESEDAKAKAEEALRSARDAAAVAAKQAAEAEAMAKQVAAEKLKAEQDQKQAEAEAARAAEEAKEKKTTALEKQADAIDTQRAADEPQSGDSGGAQIIPFPGSNASAEQPELMSSRQAITMQQPESGGMSGATIALGLGVVALLVYALKPKTAALNDVPLIAELDEDEE